MAEGIPSAAEQAEVIKKLQRLYPFKNVDKANLISANWFSEWKRSVGFGNDEPDDRPIGKIDNSDLVEDGEIRENMLENVDYAVVVEAVWDQLDKWYGHVGPVLSYDIVTDQYTDRREIQIYPSKFTVHYKEEECVVKVFRSQTVQELFDKAVKELGIENADGLEIFDCYNMRKMRQLNKSDEIPTSVYDGQDLIIDEASEYSSYYTNPMYTNTQPAEGHLLVGLQNIGNTCFFNSGVQCLAHTYPLTGYLLRPDWDRELNKTNPLGTGGHLAQAYHDTIKALWEGRTRSITPDALKRMIGRFASQFSGWGQQDSHELITFMLDGLHEDLNRCIEKPYIESVEGDGTNDSEIAELSWSNYKKRNDSIIVDLFHGQLKSRLICPNCHSTTVVFDPFMALSLPISVPHKRKVKIIYVPFDITEKQQKLTISVSENPSLDELDAAVSEKICKDVHVIVGSCSSYSTSVSWNLEGASSWTKLYAFEYPSKDKFYVPVAIQANVKVYTYSSMKDIAGPYLLEFDGVPESEEEVMEAAEKKFEFFWSPPMFEKPEQIPNIDLPTNAFEDDEQRFRTIAVPTYYGRAQTDGFEPDKKYSFICGSITRLEINPAAMNEGFSYENLLGPVIIETNTYTFNRDEDEESDTIELSKCFEYFATEETLDEDNKWFCPKCREFVCAKKKMDIWMLPKCICVHLKRFSAMAYRKLNTFVKFPEVFDFAPYVAGPVTGELKYRCYAVSEHMGSCGGGHYTAMAYSREKGAWYSFNDSSVSRSEFESGVTSSAYLLFYERIE